MQDRKISLHGVLQISQRLARILRYLTQNFLNYIFFFCKRTVWGN